MAYARDRWNTVRSPGILVKTSNTIGVSVRIYQGQYAWGDYAQTVWTCSGGWFSSRNLYINDRKMGPLPTWQDRFILIHEFGHVLGLGHTVNGCWVSIMRGDAVTGDAGCSSANPPWWDDVDGFNYIY